ncbi:MAG: hypothetical protein H0T62_04340 [Parachlamydiaceae bacterium]|nr:hypothetical protein [Parachlamydiaceae bacterium]
MIEHAINKLNKKKYTDKANQDTLREGCKSAILDWVSPFIAAYNQNEIEVLKKEYRITNTEIVNHQGNSTQDDALTTFKKGLIFEALSKRIEAKSTFCNPSDYFGDFKLLFLDLTSLHIPEYIRRQVLKEKLVENCCYYWQNHKPVKLPHYEKYYSRSKQKDMEVFFKSETAQFLCRDLGIKPEELELLSNEKNLIENFNRQRKINKKVLFLLENRS